MAEGRTRLSRKRKNYRVFVSHATADKWFATVLCEKIEAAGASTIRDDRDINGGDDIPEAIRRELKRCDEFVVLLTPQSVKRQWVLLEVSAVWGRSKRVRIVSVLYHVTVNPIPAIIKSAKAVPLNELDDYLNELAKRIGMPEQ